MVKIKFSERSIQSTVYPSEGREGEGVCMYCRRHLYMLPISPTNTTWAPHSYTSHLLPILSLSLSFSMRSTSLHCTRAHPHTPHINLQTVRDHLYDISNPTLKSFPYPSFYYIVHLISPQKS